MSRLLPTGARARDLGFFLSLGILALLGFASTYTGVQFAVVGVLGLTIGLALAHLAWARRWPGVAAILLAVLAFALLGGPLCLRSNGAAAYLPTPGTLGDLVDQLLFGWKDLLTTLPPVDGAGPLLVLPWTLGLATGVLGGLLLGAAPRRAMPRVVLPLLAPVALLVAVVLLGVDEPQSVLLQGAVFAAVALGWLTVRTLGLATRTGPATGLTAGAVRRGAGGVLLLAAAAGVAIPVGGWLSGGDDGRLVLRSYVEPPFDIGQYPSPLASFRRYVENPDAGPSNLYDDELLTVDGVPEGTLVRFAALDAYDGVVWRAAEDTLADTSLDTFQRVSRTIDNPAEGEPVQAQVTLEEGYDGVWLPTVGALTSLEFEQPDADRLQESFRYNLASGTAIVPGGLQPGVTYTITAVLPEDSLDETTPASPELPSAAADAAFLDTQAREWTDGETDPMRRVFAAAAHLKTVGKYTDGVAPEERAYHAGHHVKRLFDEFVNAPIMAGDDEQYAATMALLANRIGVPARVVMGAAVPAGGVIRGADVQAWVELRVADGTWRTLPTSVFMDYDKPAELPPQEEQEMSGSVVPPPAPVPPPSTAGEQTDSELKTRADADDASDPAFELPTWVIVVLAVVGGPLLLLLLLTGVILGLKAWRRHRRRTRGRASTRLAGAWREYVDHARDLGHPVPVRDGLTRREQAGRLGTPIAHDLARAADAVVFGPVAPDDEQAAAYWREVETSRRALSATVSRRRRLRAALSLVTFRVRWTKEPEPVVPRTLPDRNIEEPELVGS